MSTTDRATWQRQFDVFTAGSLPILETTLRPFAGLRIPVARVDSTDRPDVRDMVRLLRQEREGSQRGGWGVATDGAAVWLVLKAEIERPVRCAFQVTFDSERDRAFLEAATRSDVLAVALGWPEVQDGAPNVPHLAVRHVPAALAALLDAGESHEGIASQGTP